MADSVYIYISEKHCMYCDIKLYMWTYVTMSFIQNSPLYQWKLLI